MAEDYFASKRDFDKGGSFHAISALDEAGHDTSSLPYSIRVLLEGALRNCDGFLITKEDVLSIAQWQADGERSEIPFIPSRVILQDFTGVPAVVDLAALRDAMVEMGGDPTKVNPQVPVDLVIDHSVQVDVSGSNVSALDLNLDIEYHRNMERYRFLKWGQESLENFRVVPPSRGIVHQVNLEWIATVVRQENGVWLPDTLVGTDSHTTMINGLGVLGWGVGGIEAEAVMLGQPIYMLAPNVVGFRLIGSLCSGVTATDLTLRVVEILRGHGVVGNFVEFFGQGMSALSLPDRATIANMAPEYGATCGFFPVDEKTLDYLRLTGREEEAIAAVESYCRTQGLWYDISAAEKSYSAVLELDLGSIKPSLAGPKRPQDRVDLAHMKSHYNHTLTNETGHQGHGLSQDELSNSEAARLGREYTRENLTKIDPYLVEAREIEDEHFFIEGNEALALGSIFGGIQVLAWYPITPSSSVAEGIIKWLPELRNKDDKATYAIIQAEDELAAAGMIIGAGWAGARSMTATSGPGISLMQEFIGLSYFAEIPCVFWDVNRVGPSTGLPTRTQQGDLTMLYESSHGDTIHIVLIPGTVEECFEFGWRAFDISERYQTPVMGFSDLDLGMNRWSCKGFDYPDVPMDRGKVLLTKKQMDAIDNYGRYRDVDGDGIPYRTLPGSGLDPILYRGTGHDEEGTYSEKPDVYFKLMARLKRKIMDSSDNLPVPLFREEEECEVGIVYYGSMENIIQEIDDILEETNRKVSQCRVRALPLHSEVKEFMERHETIIVLEVNRDGQLNGIMRKEMPTELLTRIHSVAYSDGMPPRATQYADMILKVLEEVGA